ncbi:MAG: WYL domain-containing protein [Lachnospiraceae bacterium]|nr:WYL domain-containing protein [Lachnospiraceae bacterium]
MARNSGQKLKLLYLVKIFMEETDEQHGLTVQEIIQKLAAYDVAADRKTLYLDFEELRHFGIDVIAEQEGRNYYYHVGARDFELPELKLLVDSVQSAKFITESKSQELVKKLEKLVSRHEAAALNRQVTFSGRVKSMNESIYYNVDTLHEAIGRDRQIRFRYFQWNLKKEAELRHGGAWYHVSPWALLWDNENYYLVAFDESDRKIKHYRVDKMLRINVEDQPREGREEFRAFDLPKYSRSLFGMYGGEEERVTLEADNALVGVLIDRFGKDIPIISTDEAHFKTMVNVTVSPQFFGWVTALGSGIRIIAPERVVEWMKEEIRKIAELY